jgi:dihydroneopterin aldolase
MMQITPVSRVFLRDLVIEADIGIYAHEKGVMQPLVVSIDLTLDGAWFGDEDIARTVDYTELAGHARELGRTHIDLIETFAERLAARCLGLAGVLSARIRVDKPKAVPNAMAGVEIVRLAHAR